MRNFFQCFNISESIIFFITWSQKSSLEENNQTKLSPRTWTRFATGVSFFCRWSFVPHLVFYQRVSHADLTTVVLDAAARTVFPATRPEAQRRMQPWMAERRRTKISRSRCSFCSAELTVKMRRTNDDARHAVTTVRRPVVIQPAETMRRIIA